MDRSEDFPSPDESFDGVLPGLLESSAHSFIVKIWLEETAGETGRALWRGRIIHVRSRERRYIKSLDEIKTFVLPFLEKMGVKLGWTVRARRWFVRWKSERKILR